MNKKRFSRKHYKIRKFIKVNLSLYHITGIVLGTLLSALYWYKKGQYSDNILKNSILLIFFWGIAMGYITFDLIKSAISKNKKQ